MIEIKQVDLETMKGLMNLFESVFNEVDQFKVDWGIDLDVNWPVYQYMWDNKVLDLIVAYDGEVPVGFMSLLTSPHLHVEGLVNVHTDVIFVHPDYRGYTIGQNMIFMAEDIAKSKGAAALFITYKNEQEGDTITSGLGYSKKEVIYSKRILED